MKKFLIFLLILSFISICTTACTNSNKQNSNLIQSKRRFAQYIEPQQQNSNVVDLSEGPKLRYDAKLGPKNLDFDIKIVDPY